MNTQASAPTTRPETRHRFEMPHIYVILFVFTAIAAILTHFVPAGLYDRIPGPSGRTTIDPDSFRVIDSNPLGLVDFMLAIPKGLREASMVVFFTFIIGGMFMVIRRTGVIEVAVDKLTRRFAERSILVIPVLMIVFATIACICSSIETSAQTSRASPPSARIISTVSSPPGGVRSTTTTLAPSRANASAVARPMPDPAPVIRATLPSNCRVMLSLLSTSPNNLRAHDGCSSGDFCFTKMIPTRAQDVVHETRTGARTGMPSTVFEIWFVTETIAREPC